MLSHNKSPALPALTPLAFLLDVHANRTPSLLLLTGASGAGKTTWCQALSAFARRQGWAVAGLISPPVIENGCKTAIDLQDLQSGQRRRLATHTEKRHQSPTTVATGNWSFDPHTIRWGNRILADPQFKIPITKSASLPDLLIIDELGPLEFRQGQGLQAAFSLIDVWRCSLICVTIRPSLIGAARMRWPWSHIFKLQPADFQFPQIAP